MYTVQYSLIREEEKQVGRKGCRIKAGRGKWVLIKGRRQDKHYRGRPIYSMSAEGSIDRKGIFKENEKNAHPVGI
jgi:hypothetical protein